MTTAGFTRISPADFGRVAVLCGGWSAERDVSLKSGQMVFDALKGRGLDVHLVDAGRDIASRLLNEHFDRAFIVMHGRGGEDGAIQALLELLGIPYTGSGVMASALGMDKYRTKLIWKAGGLPTPGFVVLESEADLDAAAALGFPLMVKPVHEGSSIGMSKVRNKEELERAWQEAHKYDGSVLAETWVQGAEYTAAILGDRVLPMIRLETSHDFYDFEAKYNAPDTNYLCPCGLAPEVEASFGSLMLRAFRLVGARGWARVDFMLDEAGQPWLLEINTVPGMTDHSLVPMAAREAGLGFDELVWRILAESLEPGSD